MKPTTLLVLALSLSFATTYAKANEEQVLNSDPINVDGYLHDKPVTDGELEQIKSELNKQKTGTELNKEKAKGLGKLTNQTEKLLESQDEYIDQKIESTRAIKDFNNKYEEGQKKLKCIVEELNTPECEPYKDKYKGHKKAESHKVEAKKEVAQSAEVSDEEFAALEKMKVLTYLGATTYNGDVEQLETELAAGLRLESNLNNRFSIGMGFNFAQLKTEDFANNYYGNQSYSSNYYNYYGAKGREIQYRSMGIDLYGKFFITNKNRFRPYVGAGLGYNRASLKYNENDPANFSGFMFGNEEYNTSFVSGQLMAGSEILITQNFGINLEAAYSSGLGNSLSSKNTKNPNNSPDQKRLRELGEEIINSHALSIYVGAVIMF